MSLRDKICELVDAKQALFTAVSDKVWSTPELGFQEEKSAEALMEVVKAEGFELKTGLAGIPTAFSGTFGSGKPIIGFLGEFDALPNLSQEAGCDVKTPVEEGGSGHGCGHNALGAGSLAAAVALKDYIKETGCSGTVIYYGCPGEEFGCGKAFMARDGIFDHLDCSFTWHPAYQNGIWGTSSLANISVFFSFEGKTAHAAASPHMGRSALDAAELMNVGVNFLREHIIPEARVHYAFHDVGGPAPNVVQDRAKLHYYIRAPKITQSLEIFERIKKIAEGAALMTETTAIIQIKDGLCDFVPNVVLSNKLDVAMRDVGNIPFDDDDYAIAKKFSATMTDEALNNARHTLSAVYGREKAEEYIEKGLFDGILPYVPSKVAMAGSTDVGDVSYVTPTAQLWAASACLGTPHHTWQMTAQSGTSLAHKALLFAGKSMALAAARLLDDPDTIAEAREEYLAETGGVYTCPIPDDIMPLLD